MSSAIYEGAVRHRRFAPIEHAFTYRMFMMYLDLDELDRVFRGRWLWSASRPAIAWFRRRDHLGDPAQPLADAVRDLVEARTGARPQGPIRILTHLRYFGYCMNPVSFYYCYDDAGAEVESIVAEVHNTPWGEMHCYVLSRSGAHATGPKHQYEFEKSFHVSPFMGMQQRYRWRFGEPGERLPVHMENVEDGARIFTATMGLTRRPITRWQLARVLLQYPLMTVKVIAAIYLQALRLWMKRCPFVPHPKHLAPTQGDRS